MMPDASQWRSVARYDHVEKLTASGLAWEWLRRNEAYNQDFEALSGQETDVTVLVEQITDLVEGAVPGGAEVDTSDLDTRAGVGGDRHVHGGRRNGRRRNGRRRDGHVRSFWVGLGASGLGEGAPTSPQQASTISAVSSSPVRPGGRAPTS